MWFHRYGTPIEILRVEQDQGGLWVQFRCKNKSGVSPWWDYRDIYHLWGVEWVPLLLKFYNPDIKLSY